MACTFCGKLPGSLYGRAHFEDISHEDAVAVWDRLTAVPENITLLAIDTNDDVLGFGIAIPLNKQKDVSTELTGLIPVPHTFYLAELGVLPSARGRGLGRELVKQRMDLIDRERYAGVVLRVAEGRNTSKPAYEAMGFEDMGVYDGGGGTSRGRNNIKRLSFVPVLCPFTSRNGHSIRRNWLQVTQGFECLSGVFRIVFSPKWRCGRVPLLKHFPQ